MREQKRAEIIKDCLYSGFRQCENLLVIGKSFFGSENHRKYKTSSMQSQNLNYDRKANGRRRYFLYASMIKAEECFKDTHFFLTRGKVFTALILTKH